MSALNEIVNMSQGTTANKARAELAQLRARFERYTFSAVEADTDPRHIFDDTGRCIRCGEDAEEWDGECVEGWTERLERERDEARARVAMANKQLETIKEIADEELRRGSAGMWHQVEAEARHGLDENDEPATLTPRRCGTCCTEAAKAMREAAAKACYEFECDTYEDGWAEMERGARRCADVVRALPLPSCDGCNPLKPSEEEVK